MNFRFLPVVVAGLAYYIAMKVPELAQRNPVNLLNKLVEVNNEKQLVRRLPTQREVSNWVEHAKVLPRRVVY